MLFSLGWQMVCEGETWTRKPALKPDAWSSRQKEELKHTSVIKMENLMHERKKERTQEQNRNRKKQHTFVIKMENLMHERKKEWTQEQNTDSWLVGWLLNVPATCECISGTDLHRQFYVLPH